MYFPITLSSLLPSLSLSYFFPSFFSAWNRNAKDAEMKRVLPSTIRRPHRLPSRPDCSVFVSSWQSFSFVPRVSRCSVTAGTERKGILPEQVLANAHPCRILLLFCFEPRRCPSRGPCPCSSILSSSSRFVSSRLYRSAVRDQNRSESPRCPTLSFRGVQFPDKNESCTSLLVPSAQS